MPFDKFVDMETLSKERRKALQESLQSMTVAELREIVKELSDFEGDPSQENFLRVIETHPQESFYRAVTQEGAIILYCPGENTGVWFLPGSTLAARLHLVVQGVCAQAHFLYVGPLQMPLCARRCSPGVGSSSPLGHEQMACGFSRKRDARPTWLR